MEKETKTIVDQENWLTLSEEDLESIEQVSACMYGKQDDAIIP